MSDDNEIFRGYTKLIELYNALIFITMHFFIRKILTFNLGVAFLRSVSIFYLYDSNSGCIRVDMRNIYDQLHLVVSCDIDPIFSWWT